MDIIFLQLSRMLNEVADADDVGVRSHNRLHDMANILLKVGKLYKKDSNDKWLENLIVDSEEVH